MKILKQARDHFLHEASANSFQDVKEQLSETNSRHSLYGAEDLYFEFGQVWVVPKVIASDLDDGLEGIAGQDGRGGRRRLAAPALIGRPPAMEPYCALLVEPGTKEYAHLVLPMDST